MRQIWSIWILAAFLLLMGSSISYAQGQDNRPRLQIRVAIDDVTSAARCGIAAENVESEAARVLRSNGINTAQQSNPILIVRILIVILNDTSCITSTNVRIVSPDTNSRAGAFSVRPNRQISRYLCSLDRIQVWTVRGSGTLQIEPLLNACIGALEY